MTNPTRNIAALPRSWGRGLAAVALVALGLPGGAGAVTPRERAIEQIPELMGRILESQERIREEESELIPVVQEYNEQLTDAKREINEAASEEEAERALVQYVEAYASRLEAQQDALDSIAESVVRMRADARDLVQAAEAAEPERESPEERNSFYQEQFQGLASATQELAVRLGREDDAATTGAVLHASWASHGALDFPLGDIGPEGAAAFARKVEGLFARYHARSNQLAAERRSVQRLLDLLIERQLGQRLDALFADSDSLGLGALLSGEGKSADWQDLGQVVSRALGLPSEGDFGGVSSSPGLDRLDFFARGDHRE